MGYKITQREKVISIYNQTNGELRFISGKWFYKDNEIRNIKKYFLVSGYADTMNELDNIIDMYQVMYGEIGKWFDLPIIKEAKALKKLQPMCYPLNQKQLKIINYLLRHDEEIFFILTGVGGSGKSTFGNIICKIFDNDTAALNLSDLGEDFKLATGINKRLIYSTEINSDDINNGVLKQLFSNEEITINPKYEQPYKTRCQSAFFFNCNKNPRLDLCDTGMLRRILYYSMDEKIKNPDPTLNKKEWTHSDLVNIVAHALAVDMTDWKKDFEQETRYNLIKDNSVYRFKDCDDYSKYVEKCKDEGLKPFSKPNWDNIRDLLKEWWFIVPFEPVESKEPLPFKTVDIDPLF